MSGQIVGALLFVVIFSIGYFFGRYQQRNLDDEVPVLFIIRESEDESMRYDITPYVGNWISHNDDIGNYIINVGVVVRCGADDMYFPQESLLHEQNFLYATVNVAHKRKIKRKGDGYLLRLVSTSWPVKV